MKAALGDGAFMAAMERNADLIRMQCYAPLLVNVNPGGRQWRPDLIGYDALSSYGSPSYYAQQMFSSNLGDEILPITTEEISVQACATRDTKSGTIFLKAVNPTANSEPVRIVIQGVKRIDNKGSVITLAGNPEDLNSITEPRKIIPVTDSLRDVSSTFTYTLPPHSIVILKLKAH